MKHAPGTVWDFILGPFAGLAILIMLASPTAASETKPAAETTAVRSQNGVDGDDLALCLSELVARKVTFEQLGSVTSDGCELTGAVKLRSVATSFGEVAISGEPTMICSFASQFSRWVRDVGAPLSFAYTGQKLAAIETGPGLVCRTRYNKPGEKISEHAKGNAIDIASFRFQDKSRILVKQQPTDATIATDLVRTFRTTGCGYFTTVLGPGSNAAHEEHLHFDAGLHGKTSNYRICE